MSRFISAEAQALIPYTPGEQPQKMNYIKLNTNESPFAPSPRIFEAITKDEIAKLPLYPDPTCRQLVNAIAKRNGLEPEQIIVGNGSDEVLAFAFRAFCGVSKGAAFADITYGFYESWCALFGIQPCIVPLREDFSIDIGAYPKGCTAIIANPNAPTGLALNMDEIRSFLSSDPDRLVIIDEAYSDFSGESCLPLLAEYENLLIIQTFSKSRNLAGGRIGFAMGSQELISDMNRIKYSFHPYNLSRLSILAGTAAFEDEEYFKQCISAIIQERERLSLEIKALGFSVLPSKTNFVLAKSDKISGKELYERLKENGILVRWFNSERISDYIRITIGSHDQMSALIDTLKKLLEV